MAERRIHLPVQAAYDRWSAFYDDYDNPMVYLAGCILARRLDEVKGRDVFEFGCGTGRNLAAMKLAGARRVAGCDLSAGMLEMARRRGGDFALVQCDMNEAVPCADACADFVLFALTLEHVAELEKPLREAVRLLRQGGIALVVEIHPHLALDGLAAHFHEAGEEVQMPTFPHTFSDYLGAFRCTGLELKDGREWRPVDLGTPPPLQGMRRGPDFPMAVEFLLRRGSTGDARAVC